MSADKNNPLVVQKNGKSRNSKTITIWEEIQKIQKERKIYRGQECASYSFKTSLQRLWESLASYFKKSFNENLMAMEGWKENVKCYVIEQAMKYEFLDKLYDMNISRTSLFPGLDGFARSLGVFHHIFRSQDSPYKRRDCSEIIWHEE